MILGPDDLHLLFNDETNKAVLWRKRQQAQNVVLLEFEMRNDTVRRWFLRWGWCPRGEYLLGSPSHVHAPAYGEWFTPLFDLSHDGPMHKGGRSGIGIHGGGTGLSDPYALHQGWVPTHGCLRVQNEDNAALVQFVKECQAAGHSAYITVTGTAGTR